MNRKSNEISNTFSTLALILGILGLVTMCCLYTGLIFGGLAIIFGLLSRGNARKCCGQAQAGVILGTIAIIATVALFAGIFVTTMHQYGGIDNFMKDVMDQSEQLMDQYLNQLN